MSLMFSYVLFFTNVFINKHRCLQERDEQKNFFKYKLIQHCPEERFPNGAPRSPCDSVSDLLDQFLCPMRRLTSS